MNHETLSDEHFRIIVETTPDAVVTTNTEGIVVYWNSAAEKLFGYGAAEMVGKPMGMLLPDWLHESQQGSFSPGQSPENRSIIGNSIATICRRKEGETFPSAITVSCWKVDDELFYTAIIRDISERVNNESLIRQTRDFLENVFRATGDGILVTDTEGIIIRVNKAILKMLDLPEEEVLGKHIAELVPRTFHPEPMLERLLEDGFVENYESMWERRDGTCFPIESNIATLQDNKGNISGAVAAIRDITKRKLAEDALRASEERFRILTQSASDAIIFVDNAGKILFWNERARKIYGYEAREVVGKSSAIIVPEDFKERHVHEFEKHKKDSTFNGVMLETSSRKKDGTLFPIEFSFSAGMVGQDTFYCAIVRDITERKLAEQALRETNDYLDNIIKSSIDCIIISDNKGRVRKANQSFLDLVGCSQEAIEGRSMADFMPGQPGDYDCTTGATVTIGEQYFGDISKRMEELFSVGRISGWESYFIRGDGVLVPVDQNTVMLFSEEGEAIGAVGVVRDITERKRAEEMLDRVNSCLLQFGPYMDANIQLAVETAGTLLKGDAAVYLKEGEGGCRPAAGWRLPGNVHETATMPQGFWKAVRKHEKPSPIVMNDLMREPFYSSDPLLQPGGMKTCIAANIVNSSGHAGALAVFYNAGRAFDSSEEKIFSILAQAIGSEEERKKVFDQLRENQEKLLVSEKNLKLFSGKILSIREEEKKRISMNLHDELGSMAISVGTRLSIAKDEIRDGNKDTAVDVLQQMKNFFKQSLGRIRKIAVDLRPPELDIIGLPAALKDYCRRTVQESGVDLSVSISVELGEATVTSETSITLYRVTQEALNNIIRHSRAAQATFKLTVDGNTITYIIKDNGVGFVTDCAGATAGHVKLGVQGMRERVESLGGRFVISSAMGKGTKIEIALPLEHRQELEKELPDVRRAQASPAPTSKEIDPTKVC